MLWDQILENPSMKIKELVKNRLINSCKKKTKDVDASPNKKNLSLFSFGNTI